MFGKKKNKKGLAKRLTNKNLDSKPIKVETKETFQILKFLKGLLPFSMIWWAKAVSETVKIIVVFLVVIGLVFGFGYFQGKKHQPVKLGYKNFKVRIIDDEGKKHYIEVKNNILYFDKRMVRVKDVPKLKPYGIGIKPKLFAGIGKEGIDAGLGATVAWYQKVNLDIFGTFKRVGYIGISRDIEFGEYIKNSSVGFAVGTKIEDLLNKNKQEVRFLVYWSMKF